MTSDVFVFPASFAQQRLWFLDKLLPDNAYYNMSSIVSLSGAVDLDALRRSLHALVDRHESLRTTFAVVDEVTVQVIAEVVDVQLPIVDLRTSSPAHREDQVRQIAAVERATSFDLTRGPLLRATVIRLGDEGDLLLLTLHHIVSDGWSMQVFFRELAAVYDALSTGCEPELPSLAVQYADFAVWQRQWLQERVLEQQLAYWRTQLAGAPAWLSLPTDRARPAAAILQGRTRLVRWSPERTASIRALAHQEASTVFLVLLAAFTTVLSRYSGQDDMVVGTPVANRVATETEPLIGFFVNTLALRTSLSGDPTFVELLGRVRAAAAGAFANQDLPFERVVAELMSERHLNRAPLFQVMLAVQSDSQEPAGGAEADSEPDEQGHPSWHAKTGTAKFDLTLSLRDRGQDISGWLEYASDLFDPPTIDRLLDHLGRVIDQVVVTPRVRLSQLTWLSTAEHAGLVDEWNDTATNYPRQKPVHSLFEDRAAASPLGIAAIYGDVAITYRELNARANRLARRLRAHGAGRDALVAVLLPPSTEMLVALLAILKAGAAYVPLDPADPPERLRFMLEDAEARVLVTEATGPPGGVVADDGNAVVRLEPDTVSTDGPEDRNLDLVVAPSDLAYVIYTSGSTGEPKGVAIEHRSIVRLVRDTDYLNFDEQGVFAQMSHPSFDAATFEIWGALLSGSTIIGIPKSVALSPRELAGVIERRQITTLFITTALFNHVAREAPDAFSGLRTLLTGGEANDPSAMKRVLEHSRPERLLHVYGPTESTTFATWHNVSRVSEGETNVPIGRPVANTRAYVLGEQRELLPIGAPGELYLGGDGIARGYWRRPELTSEQFVADPFGGGQAARLYRTGDLVRYRSDGALIFLGRRDNQVKIRGFRIELGEIESVLREQPHVADAVVLPRDDVEGDKRLVAWLVARDAAEELPGHIVLSAHVHERLPAWMIPARFIWVDELPLTPSGKVDRRLLADMPGQEAAHGPIEAPATATERTIAAIWRELLGLEEVGASAGFFEIGGHSLLAAQVIARVRDRLGVDVPVRTLFAAPTLREFARVVDRARSGAGVAAAVPALPLVRRTNAALRQSSFAQQRLWFLAQLDPSSPVYNVPDVIPLDGRLRLHVIAQALTEIVWRHDVLRTTIAAVHGVPMQVIAPPSEVDLPCDDWRSYPPLERERLYVEARADEASRPFDLARGPLIRLRLLQLTDADSRLMVTLHHAICDGWSLQVLRTELDALLDAFTRGQPSPLPDLPVTYGDYAEWQRDNLLGERLDGLVQYWRERLTDAPPILELPSDRPRPRIQTFSGAMMTTRVSPDLAHALRAFSTEQGATLFTTLVASFAVLLARYTGQRDVVIGTPVAGRTHTEMEPLIGLFVNTLPLRIDLSADPAFTTLLGAVNEAIFDAYAHQDLPFDRLVSELAPARRADVAPIVQVLFDLQRRPAERVAAGMPGTIVETHHGVAKFELTLAMIEDADGLVASIEYSTDRFEAAGIRRMLQNLQCLFAVIVEEPERLCSRLPLVHPEERQALLSEWNADPVPHDIESCVPGLVRAQVRRTPDAVAVLSEMGSLTFRELEARAGDLAFRIRARGVKAGDPVGLCLDRTGDFVVALLGILQSGGVCVPLDATHPEARLQFLLQDSGARLLVTDTALAPMFASVETLCVDGALEPQAPVPDAGELCVCGAGSLASIVYTSGSTGRPKGVAVEHRSLVNLALAIGQRYELRAGDRVLQLAPLVFDVSAEEIFPTLAAGAAVVPWPDGMHPSIEELFAFLDRFGITVVNLPSPYWHALVDALAQRPALLPSSLRLVVAGSDRTSLDRLLTWQQCVDGRVKWLNAYGTTEATVTSTVYEPQQPATRGVTPWVPIGRPIGNVRAYVLDEHRELLPAGAPGELFIGGEGVARGYINRLELTAERFGPDPFSHAAGARMYQTGDRARLRGDGDLELLGRLDDQIKVRGFRIEPAEIERVLVEHAAIRDAAIVASANGAGEPRLTAYVVPRQWPPPAFADLRTYLDRRLPEYMVPTGYVALQELPMTAAGKLDRARLPAASHDLGPERTHVPPRTPAERQLAQLWAQVLGVDRVGVTDNFFELGGDSILSIQIISRAAELGLRYTPRQLFQHQTIAELAPLAGTSRGVVSEQGPVVGLVALTPIQHWFFEQSPVDSHHYNQSVLLVLESDVDPERLERAFAYLVDTHDALRLRFRIENGTVQQVHAPPGSAAFSSVDLRAVHASERDSAIAAAANECQAGLNLASGPIARALYIGLADSSRLLLVVHHLAIDGVSWRVILQDLRIAYDQLTRGESMALPPKTTSYQHWATRLLDHARSEALKKEAGYWQSVVHRADASLPLDVSAGANANTEAAGDVVTTTLSRSETEALLRRVPHAYRTQINDVLLLALARGFSEWAGGDSLLVDLEGHGREPLFDDVDVSRTVGWFTTIFPVSVDAAMGLPLGDALKGVKENLRRIPNKGIGFGLLRYLSPEADIRKALNELPRAEVSFNYLGQFEEQASGGGHPQIADEWGGFQRSPARQRSYLLDVTGGVYEGHLSLSIMFCSELHRRTTIQSVAARVIASLRELIAHCAAADGRDCTPSDFPLAQLDQDSLNRLVDVHGTVEDIYPLSPMQAGLLFHTLLAPEAGEYVEQLALDLGGGLDIAALKRAWEAVVQRHAVLRTAFVWDEVQEPLQVVRRAVELPWEVVDYGAIDDAGVRTRSEEWLRQDRRAGYNLSTPPLMRLAAAKLPSGRWRLLWSCHHLLLDGWSVPLVLREVGDFYEAFRAGREAALAHPRPYREYIAWIGNQDMAAAERFWRQALRGFSTPTPLVVDRIPSGEPGRDTHDDARLVLDRKTTDALQALARQHRLTLNTIVQAVWAIILSRYSGCNDVVFGATVSGRPAELAGIEAMVGLFINTLPVRVRIAHDTPIVHWLERIQEEQSAARQFEYTPLVSIQGWSEVRRGTPLFESVLVFENYPGDSGSPRDEGADPFHVPALERTSYPLTIAVVPGVQLTVKITYDCGRLNRGAVERMLGHFATVLTTMAASPYEVVGSLPLLTPAEREQALVLRNLTATDVPYGTCIDMFEAQLRRTPDALAVVADDGSLTYEELARRAACVARYLRTQGVGADVPVALCLERGSALAVGLLGILAAGGAYVPLATSYPDDRIDLMLGDTGAAIVLTQASLRHRLARRDCRVVCLDDDWAVIQAAPATALVLPRLEDLAYVIYTSGSTGRPKGAALPHGALANLICWQNGRSTPRPGARVLQFAPISFDVCFQECFSTWTSGGTLVFVSNETQRDPVMLAQAIEAHRIDRMFLPFVALQQLAEVVSEAGDLLAMKEVITAGEQLHVTPALRQFFSDRPWCTLHNQYGPSETHVATAFTLSGAPAGWPELPPIGLPIANTRAYVLDAAMRPVPVGVPGELFLGGLCLARGYWDRPELTLERFVPDPFDAGSGARLYRTGDLVRVSDAGELEFLGRLDDQVKIRGFRVEPAEIESVLREHADVGQAAVAAHGTHPGDRVLVAYLVAAQARRTPPDPAALRRHLERKLPDWMVPAIFMWLDALPLTPSGKVDRRALPAPDAPAPPESTFVAPRTSGERALATAWQEVLGVDRVSAHDHFFELGGHSLLATRLVARIRRELGIELPLRAVFDAPVLSDLAERLNDVDRRLTQPTIFARPIERDAAAVSFGQERLWFLEQMNRHTVFHIATVIPVTGAVQPDIWRRALNDIVRRHAVLRTTFAAVDGVPVQRIAAHMEVPLAVEDLRTWEGAARDAARLDIVRSETETTFDLASGPLVRARLIRLTAEESQLAVTFHHIVADGWSLSIFRRELITTAAAFSRGESSSLPPLRIQYCDFAEWQRDRLQGQVLADHLDYWRRQLAGAPPTLEFPLDRPRPAVRSYAGSMLTVRVPATVVRELQAIGRREGATLFMTLLSAFALLLSRQTGQTDIVIGAPVAGRTHAETEPLIGFFLNHLPLRVGLAGRPTFRDLVRHVRDVTLGAYEHQELPFELLLERLRPERHPSHTPVFQVFFNLLNFERPIGVSNGEDEEPVEVDASQATHTWSPFDFTLYAAEEGAGIELQLVYRTSLFEAERMAELLTQLSTLLAHIARDPEGPLETVSLVTARSRTFMPDPTLPLGDAWNGAVHLLFTGQAAAQPDAVAVSDEHGSLTYGELDALTDRLAGRLREDGVVAEDVVAIYAHRSAALVCAILGVMKAGATYIILDPAYPPARLIEYLELARPVAWVRLEAAGPVPDPIHAYLAGIDCRSHVEIPRRPSLEEAYTVEGIVAADPVGPDRIACISFTSGSTGRAKGVLQRHGPLTHFTPWIARTFSVTRAERFSMLSGLSHDPLQRDIFTPLVLGASIHIPAHDILGTPGRLAAWFRDEGITVGHLTPAMCQVFTQHASDAPLYGGSLSPLSDLRLVFFVGDKVTRTEISRLRMVAPDVTCVNFYGSTETQRAVGYFVDAPVPGAAWHGDTRETLPVGRGVEDVQLLVLTSAGGLAGVGELGEIHVRSPHLASGYLQDPVLTRERFLLNPFTGVPGDRMYRSGDLGRYLPDGNVEFVGRVDSQVKIRGFRVEPAEIEALLRSRPDIQDVAVVPRAHGEAGPRLLAYVVPVGDAVADRELRRFVADRLPDYMVPAAFVTLDALPMTPNGKLDRAALPDPVAKARDETSVRSPRDAVEATLMSLWRQALDATAFGIDDNFFELGGHSLLASQVLSRMRDALHVDVPLGQLFQHPTIAELAELVAAARADGLFGMRPPLRPVDRERHRARRDPAGGLIVPAALRQVIRDMVGTVAPPRKGAGAQMSSGLSRDAKENRL